MSLQIDYWQREKLEGRATRDGFGRGLMAAGLENNRVIVLTADLSESTRVLEFQKKWPQRFIQMGVAEQNMAGVAAGLALTGFIPFMTSYAVFSPGRNWEQIRVSIGYNNANVKIIGHHAGVSVGADGATHQALEDIALMRVLPRMTVLSPADANEAQKATVAAARIKGPVYIRLSRAASPVFTTSRSSFHVGQIVTLLSGNDVTLIATGPLVYEALIAARALARMKIEAEVLNCHTIKPIDTLALIASVRRTGAVVTIEEHQVAGGLGGAVAEVLATELPTPQEFVGIQDDYGQSGTPQELWRQYHLTADDIVRAAVKAYRRKG